MGGVSRRALVAIVLLAASAGLAQGHVAPLAVDDTPLAGLITTNTTWALADSPFWVEGDVEVIPGVTLTIDPGVEVRFNGPFDLAINGTLVAIGTAAQPIRLTTNATTPTPGDWGSLVISGGGSTLEHVQVSYGDRCFDLRGDDHHVLNGVFADCAEGVHVSGARNVIEAGTFSGMGPDGVWITGADNVLLYGIVQDGWGVQVDGQRNRLEGTVVLGAVPWPALESAGSIDGQIVSNTICCGAYVYSAMDMYLEGNSMNAGASEPITFEASTVTLAGNIFENLTLVDSVATSSSDTFFVLSASNGTFDGVNNTLPTDPALFTLSTGSNVTVVNGTAWAVPAILDSASVFTRRWFLEVEVQELEGLPVPGAFARVTDNLGAEVFNGTAGPDGVASWIALTQSVDTSVTSTPHTPHTVTALLDGPDSSSLFVDMDASKGVIVILVRDDLPPRISTSNPSPSEATIPVNITATVDDATLASVFLNVTFPDASWQNDSMSGGAGAFYLERTYAMEGDYVFEIIATDLYGNLASAPGQFTIVPPNDPPSITDAKATPDPQEVSGTVTISAVVTDPDGLANVEVGITHPEGSKNVHPMVQGPGDVWSYAQVFSTPGIYGFAVSATDANPTTPRTASTSGTFVIQDTTPPTIQATIVSPDPVELGQAVLVTVEATDALGILNVVLSIEEPDGTVRGPFAMAPVGGDQFQFTYGTLSPGTHDYQVWATDLSTPPNVRTAMDTFLVQDTITPSADAGLDQSVPYGTEATLDGTGSSDNDPILNFTWRATLPTGPLELYGSTVTHTFADLGPHILTLTVRDRTGRSDADTVVITVYDASPPVISDLRASVDPVEAPGATNVTFSVTDASPLQSVRLLVLSPSGSPVADLTPPLDVSTSRYYDERVLGTLGTYRYLVFAEDSGGRPSSDEIQVTVQDTTAPNIDSVGVDAEPVQVLTPLTIWASVSDAFPFDVSVSVVDPTSTPVADLEMTWDATDSRYEAMFVPEALGAYVFEVGATDGSANAAADVGDFLSLDSIDPTILSLDVNPSPVPQGSTAEISISASDDFGIDSATISFVDPEGVGTGPLEMSFDASEGRWRHVRQFDLLGSYEVTVVVRDLGGNAAEAQDVVVAVDGTPPSVRDLTWTPETWEVGGTIRVSAVVEDDVALASVVLIVTEPGGSETGTHTMSCDTSGLCSFERPFTLAGTYAVTVEATDDTGNMGSLGAEITIVPGAPPVARAGEDLALLVGGVAMMDGSASTDDFAITSYRWSFSYQGRTQTLEGAGVSFLFDEAGEYEITLTVEDSAGRQSTDVIVVTVTDPNADTAATLIALGLVVGLTAGGGAFLVVQRRRTLARGRKASVPREEIEQGVSALDEDL